MVRVLRSRLLEAARRGGGAGGGAGGGGGANGGVAVSFGAIAARLSRGEAAKAFYQVCGEADEGDGDGDGDGSGMGSGRR